MQPTSAPDPSSLFSGAVPAAYPDNEEDRIQKLLSYRVLDTEAESAYDDLTAIATQICGTPTSVVSLIDVDRQWFKSTVGLDATETHRDLAFCAHAILTPQVLVVPDARLDERFASNPLVTGPPYIRFYAGAPLITPEGYALGTLCIIDSEPRDLSPVQIKTLEALARQVVNQLEIRLTLEQIQREVVEKEKAQATLRQINTTLKERIQERTEAVRQKNQALEKTLNELQLAQANLVHSEKIAALGQLLSGVAHEINNPLGFVSGSIDHAQEYVADLMNLIKIYHETYGEQDKAIAKTIKEIDLHFIRKDLVEMLGAMEMSTNRIIEIVRSLRNFSRIERQGFRPADIHAGIDSTLMLLSYRTRMVGKAQRPINIVKHYSQLPRITCDIGQINQVLMNLLVNAIDALEQTGHEQHEEDRENEPTITIETQANEGSITIVIRDNGSGMKAETVEKIFQPFFTTKPMDQGTGLGLSISHQVITQKHQGEISCQSKLGEGTAFTIKLPDNLPISL